MPVKWMHVVGKCLPTLSEGGGRGGDKTGNAGSDAQKKLRFNSQALACDQGASTSTLLTLHHTSQLQPTSSRTHSETDIERNEGREHELGESGCVGTGSKNEMTKKKKK